jgi:hypothetical protein
MLIQYKYKYKYKINKQHYQITDNVNKGNYENQQMTLLNNMRIYP